MEAQQYFRLARIASKEGCRTFLVMTVESFRIARKAKHKKAQWIPACAGMTTYAGKEKKHFSNSLLLPLPESRPIFECWMPETGIMNKRFI
jgi:hypothetical protein